jgi:molybdate transport system substrate-binding protein
LALLSKDGLMTKVMYFFATLWCCTRKAHAAEVGVAVAANFTAPMQKIALAFEQATGHKAVLSFGSTDMFYAQIRNGAPFQVLLSADDETPIKLEKDGLGVAGKGLTYATRKTGSVERAVGRGRAQGAVLRSGRFEWRGIANPKLAPYGAAALQTWGWCQNYSPNW